MSYREANYIRLEDVIKVIDDAAKNRLITQRAANLIIDDLYRQTEPNKFKHPSYYDYK